MQDHINKNAKQKLHTMRNIKKHATYKYKKTSKINAKMQSVRKIQDM